MTGDGANDALSQNSGTEKWPKRKFLILATMKKSRSF
jgi:hypothetical protein